MKMTYSEYVEKLTDYIDDQHAGSDGEIVLGGDFSLALRKILTDVLPLIRDIEASAATVPTVEVDTGEEDDIPDFAPIVGSDIADPQGDFTANGWAKPTVEQMQEFLAKPVGELAGLSFHESGRKDPYMSIGALDYYRSLVKFPAGDTASLREYIRDGWAKCSAMRAGRGFYEEMVAKALVTGSSFYAQDWDTLTGKLRITAVDPYEEEK